MRDKAQLFTWDLIFSVIIFIIVLASIIYLWDMTVIDIDASLRKYEISRIASSVSEQLVRTPGIPENWSKDPTRVIVIGLAWVDRSFGQERVVSRVIDPDKLLQFINLNQNYHLLRGRLLGTGDYEFYAKISCLNSSNRGCFDGHYINTIENGKISCLNGFNFTVRDHYTDSYVWREAEDYDLMDGVTEGTSDYASNNAYIKITANKWVSYNFNTEATFQTFAYQRSLQNPPYNRNIGITGNYTLWIRASNVGGPKNIEVNIDDNYHTIPVSDTGGADNYTWVRNSTETVLLTPGKHKVKLSKSTDFIRIDAILLTTDPSYDPNLYPEFGNFHLVQPTVCLIGNHETENATDLLSVKKQATLVENLDKTIRLELVIWKGVKRIIPIIPVYTLQCHYYAGAMGDPSCDTGTCIASMGSDYIGAGGAHIANCSIYSNKICCEVTPADCGSLSCDSGNCIFSVGSDFDSPAGDHISGCGSGIFSREIQCSVPVACGNLQCSIKSSCDPDEACLFSVGSDYNDGGGAHIRECGGYSNKLCCKI